MASDVTMPRLSDSMEEGTVLKWLVDEGGEVKRGEPLVEIETDKANMTYDADTDGVLIEIVAQEGDTLEIGEVIARIGEAGEAKSDGGGKAEAGRRGGRGAEEAEAAEEEKEAGDEAEAGDEGEEAEAAEEEKEPATAEAGRRGRRRRTRPPRPRVRRLPSRAPMAAAVRPRRVRGPQRVRRLRPETVTGA